MKALRRHAGIALIALLAGCGERSGDPAAATPAAPHAAAVLRSETIRIADRAEIDISVTTAPGWRLLPIEPPRSLPGFEIVDWRRLPVVRERGRWIHPHRVRLRALEVGRFEWPVLKATVSAKGEATEVEIPPLELDVDSIMDAYPNRSAPFGARSAPAAARAQPGRSPVLGAALSALLLTAAAFLLVSRRRSRKARGRSEPLPAAWNTALAEFDRAAELADRPAAASHRASNALHGYMGRRFGARTRVRTSEELAEIAAPYGATSSWPAFVELLRDFDDLRFRPAGDEGDDRRIAAFTATLERARAFVEATTPPAGLR